LRTAPRGHAGDSQPPTNWADFVNDFERFIGCHLGVTVLAVVAANSGHAAAGCAKDGRSRQAAGLGGVWILESPDKALLDGFDPWVPRDRTSSCLDHLALIGLLD
jgi:hypothetical protein